MQLKPREGVAHKNAGIQLAKTYIFIWPNYVTIRGTHLLEFAVLNLSEYRYRVFGLWYCFSGMAVLYYHLIRVAASDTTWQAL